MKASVPGFARRELVQAAACAMALALPTLARPQSVARVAWVSTSPANDGTLFFNELRNGLRELGYVEARNLALDAYWGDYGSDLLNKISLEAIATQPQVIVAQGSAALALRLLNPSVPSVFGFSGDPVEACLVQSIGAARRQPDRHFLPAARTGGQAHAFAQGAPSSRCANASPRGRSAPAFPPPRAGPSLPRAAT